MELAPHNRVAEYSGDAKCDMYLRALGAERFARIVRRTSPSSGVRCAPMEIRPLSDRILIIIDEEPSVTPGGLVLPERRTERGLSESIAGRVLAVGPGRRDERGDLVPVAVSVGDRVLFEKYAAGNEVPTFLRQQVGGPGGQKLALVRDGDLLGVIDDQVPL